MKKTPQSDNNIEIFDYRIKTLFHFLVGYLHYHNSPKVLTIKEYIGNI